MVQCTYRSGWHGRVEAFEVMGDGTGGYVELPLVRLLYTADGRPQQRRLLKRYSSYWLRPSRIPSGFSGDARKLLWTCEPANLEKINGHAYRA